MDDLTARIAETVRRARLERGLSLNQLADRSGVSRAMIGRIEAATAQPTAALLARLSGALSLTLSELVARAEDTAERVARRGAQPTWTDPDTGYIRRAVSPPAGAPLELVEVSLPPGARVDAVAESYAFIHQQIWVLDGHLRFHEGDEVHELDAGDCLQLGSPAPCAFVNPTDAPVRYLVALVNRGAGR